jgi:serine protease Do
MGLIVPLDSAGRLAGVDFYDSGIGFAVPFSDLVKLLPRLMLGEKLEPAFLGIEADQTKVRGGITLKKVVQRSPASKAGLKEGDIITHLDGSEVKTFFELHFALGAKVAGDEIVIKYIRDGVVRETKAKLGVRKQMIGESPFGVEPGDKPGAKPKIPAVPGAPGGKKAPEEKPAKPDDGHDEHDGHDHGKEKP